MAAIPYLMILYHTELDTKLTGKSDQLFTETATYTTHSKQNRRTSTLQAEFEPSTPAIERMKTYALHSRAPANLHYIFLLPDELGSV